MFEREKLQVAHEAFEERKILFDPDRIDNRRNRRAREQALKRYLKKQYKKSFIKTKKLWQH